MEIEDIPILIQKQLFVQECFINNEDFLCMKFYVFKKKQFVVVEFDPYWRLEKKGIPILGSIDEENTITDTLSLLKERQLIDFSLTSLLDLSLFFNQNICLTIFRGQTEENALKWKQSPIVFTS